MLRISLQALGCRLNEAELEELGQVLCQHGHSLVRPEEEADVIVLNSCGVTQAAMRKSRNLARRCLQNKPKLMVLMGCALELAERDEGFLRKEEEEEYCLLKIGQRDKARAADLILQSIDKHQIVSSLDAPTLNHQSHTRRFLKVQDGCNNQCSYCSVRLARGQESSVSLEHILAQAKLTEASGIAELILTGVQLGAWQGSEKQGLASLLSHLLRETGIARFRLSSIEPWHMKPVLWKMWTENSRLCPHFHIPIQSGSEKMLRAMRRRVQHIPDFLDLLARLRAEIPKLRLSTDLIIGFPGEDEGEWQKSLDFLSQAKFDDVHLFRFSPRPKTVAFSLPEQVPAELKQRRLQEAQSLIQSLKAQTIQRHLGERAEVLWESPIEERAGLTLWQGYSENYLRILRPFPSQVPKRGSIDSVCLEAQDLKL